MGAGQRRGTIALVRRFVRAVTLPAVLSDEAEKPRPLRRNVTLPPVTTILAFRDRVGPVVADRFFSGELLAFRGEAWRNWPWNVRMRMTADEHEAAKRYASDHYLLLKELPNDEAVVEFFTLPNPLAKLERKRGR